MATLAELVEKKLSGSKMAGVNNKAEFNVAYSTGFLHIDYLNGTTVYVEGHGKNFHYNSTGIVDGSTNTIIGRSGSGKSTLMFQIFGYFLNQFPECHLYMDDIEGSLPEARKFFLLDLSEEDFERRVHIRNSGITTENVYAKIRAIYDSKISNKKEFTYDTGLYDIQGNRITKFVPTLYGIDSFAMLMPENIEESDDLGTNMVGGQTAKQNSMLVKKISQLCKEANIILFTINHIATGIQTGYIPKQSQLAGLASDERLPGGQTAIYLANNLFRVDDGAKLTPDKDYGIDGSVIKFTIIKSRTNANRKSIPLIFNKTTGKFDELLSYFHLLKSEGKFDGAGAHLYFNELPDVKFNARSFKEVYQNNPELQEVFGRKLFELLSTYLSVTKSTSRETKKTITNLNDMFARMGNGELQAG